MNAPQVARTAHYFPADPGPRFAWLHEATGVVRRGCVAVLCPPIGPEYTRGHRAVRHLADGLARAGIPALRFDYHGSGDSPGSDADPGRLRAWLADVRAAVAHARALVPGCQVALVGLRLGATLAAIASESVDVDFLVLWNAVVKGRTFVRELKVMAATAEAVSELEDGGLEGGGYVLTGETVQALGALDLALHKPRATRGMLVVRRDDQDPDAALAKLLADAGAACDTLAVPGWNAMVADHQFTQVPHAGIAAVADWLAARSPAVPEPPATALPDPVQRVDLGDLEEIACRFGPGQCLFGILSRPITDRDLPVVLLFNAGSIHHVGPHRLYVELARALGREGHPVFRMDVGGVGDSVCGDPARENHPYPENAVQDALSALRHLQERFGYRRFVPAGLCSGAHTAFHAALASEDAGLVQLLLVNPLTFQFEEGMSLETTVRIYDVQGYRASARDWRRWMQVLRGQVSLRRPIATASRHAYDLARSFAREMLGRVNPAWGPDLSRRLRTLYRRGLPIRMVISEGDPGYDLARSEARVAVRSGERSGALAVRPIAAADHTFSQRARRRELVALMLELLRPGPTPPRRG